MSANQEDELDDEVAPKPLWRRPRIVFLVGSLAIAAVFVFVQNKTPPERPSEKTDAQFIGVVAPYTPAPTMPLQPAPIPLAKVDVPPVPTPPIKTNEPPAVIPPASPTFADFKTMAAPARMQMTDPPLSKPRSMAYAAPRIDSSKSGSGVPTAPVQTVLDFKSGVILGMKASPAVDETYQLPPGLLPMVLDTAIDSNLPGPILAHLIGPVYSPKGVLLMEADTQIIGKYETLGKSGSSRLMASSMYAHTPNGIWVPLSGMPMSDDLGRSGLPGAIDNHVPERIGGALILSLTESLLKIVEAKASSGGNTYLNLNGGGGGLGGIAQQILQSTINIAPTFSKHQGETIALFLDAPIDFSNSYRIKNIRQ